MYDALIIGGGPAGATLGLLLSQAGWSVAIVEKKNFPRRKVCGEFISPATLSLFNQLNIAEDFFSLAGPAVKEVGLFTGKSILTSPMPQDTDFQTWGHALGREHLDKLLLDAAKQAGATVWQPWTASHLTRNGQHFSCILTAKNDQKEITSHIVILAQGSWEKRIDQTTAFQHKPSDLLAFKAHFSTSTLPQGLMPLFVFAGGYGGIVHTDSGRVSLSCCVRRDRLTQIRHNYPGIHAGEALFLHLLSVNAGIKQVLGTAKRDASWLATGPIRPGIRTPYKNGIFYVGNIAGEAHPIIAEGISMAIQSAWLLSKSLLYHQKKEIRDKLDDIGAKYTHNWRKKFVTRIYSAALFAHIASHPYATRLSLPLIQAFPEILTLGARLSGKR